MIEQACTTSSPLSNAEMIALSEPSEICRSVSQLQKKLRKNSPQVRQGGKSFKLLLHVTIFLVPCALVAQTMSCFSRENGSEIIKIDVFK